MSPVSPGGSTFIFHWDVSSSLTVDQSLMLFWTIFVARTFRVSSSRIVSFLLFFRVLEAAREVRLLVIGAFGGAHSGVGSEMEDWVEGTKG